MKPFDKEELFIRLEQLINIRQQLQQKYQSYRLTKEPINSTNLEERFLQKLYETAEKHFEDSDFGVEKLARESIAELRTYFFVFLRQIKWSRLLLSFHLVLILSFFSFLTIFAIPKIAKKPFDKEELFTIEKVAIQNKTGCQNPIKSTLAHIKMWFYPHSVCLIFATWKKSN